MLVGQVAFPENQTCIDCLTTRGKYCNGMATQFFDGAGYINAPTAGVGLGCAAKQFFFRDQRGHRGAFINAGIKGNGYNRRHA
jgi:hypothetical protein